MPKSVSKLALVIGLICLVLGALVLVQQKRQKLDQATEYGQKPRPVTVAGAKQGDLSLKQEYLAGIKPGQEAKIASRVQAEVLKVLVDEGDQVEAGEVLLRLNATEIRHRLEEVRARMKQSQSELEGKRATILYLESSLAYWQKEKQRKQRLAKQKATSLSEAEKTAEKAAEVQGRLQAARNEAEALQHSIQALKQQEQEVQTRLGYYTLHSPGPGTISERSVEPGDMASPSQVLLRLQSNKQLKIAFDVPQKDLPQIREGLECIFSVNGNVRKSRIDLLHPALDKARMMRAEVWLHGEQRQGLSPGAYLPIAVVINKLQEVILVPRSALIPSPAGREHVFVVHKNRLQARKVQVLGFNQDKVAVKGISPGEQVLQNTYLGWARLSSGQKIKAIP